LKNYDLIITDSIESKKDILRFYKLPEAKVKVIYPTVSRLFVPHLDTSKESVAHHHPFHTDQEHSIPEFTEFSLNKLSKNPGAQR